MSLVECSPTHTAPIYFHFPQKVEDVQVQDPNKIGTINSILVDLRGSQWCIYRQIQAVVRLSACRVFVPHLDECRHWRQCPIWYFRHQRHKSGAGKFFCFVPTGMFIVQCIAESTSVTTNIMNTYTLQPSCPPLGPVLLIQFSPTLTRLTQ